MKLFFRQLNPHSCLTYLFGDEDSREAVIVDPVLDHVNDYIKMLDQEKLKLRAIIDTHTHADHISGGAALLDEVHCAYLMHQKAAAACPSRKLSDGEKLEIAGTPIRVLHTPGHTKDSISLILPDKILTGDALFLDDGGAGRDDLPGGDPGEHWDSLQRILGLPDNLMVYPAHEYRHRKPSTLQHQKQSNPFLKRESKEDYVQFLQELKLGPADWMKDVLKANYACARDPKAAWIPADSSACEVKGTMATGANDIHVPEISAQELKQKIEKHEALVLVDVRDPDELKGDLGALPGAINLPVAALSHHLDTLESHRNDAVITICKGGGRAHTAAQILIQAGFKSVRKLSGGMTAFRKIFPV